MSSKIGKMAMSVIGGSSGVYGSALHCCSKGVKGGIEVLHDAELCTVLKAMPDAIVAEVRQRKATRP